MNEFDLKASKWDNDPIKIERAIAVAEGIKKVIPLTNTMKGFEYGCGTGLLSFALQPFLGSLILADSSEGMLSVLNDKIAESKVQNMSYIKLDLETDELPDQKYDLIYTLMTLHHIADIEKILGKFYDMLGASGYLCIADLYKEDGSFHGNGFNGHNGFEELELTKLIKNAGFSVVDFSRVFKLYKGEGENKKEYPIFLMIAKK